MIIEGAHYFLALGSRFSWLYMLCCPTDAGAQNECGGPSGSTPAPEVVKMCRLSSHCSHTVSGAPKPCFQKPGAVNADGTRSTAVEAGQRALGGPAVINTVMNADDVSVALVIFWNRRQHFWCVLGSTKPMRLRTPPPPLYPSLSLHRQCDALVMAAACSLVGRTHTCCCRCGTPASTCPLGGSGYHGVPFAGGSSTAACTAAPLAHHFAVGAVFHFSLQ